MQWFRGWVTWHVLIGQERAALRAGQTHLLTSSWLTLQGQSHYRNLDKKTHSHFGS